jgi:hypothetical protein
MDQPNAANPGQTSNVTFDKLLNGEDDPVGLRVISNEFQDFQRPNSVWSPAFEVGVQFESFFSLFYGISFYNVQQSYSRQSPVYKLNEVRMAIHDTFPFSSSATNNWGDSFDSTIPTLRPGSGTPESQNYFLLSADGAMNGSFPTRSFITVLSSNTDRQENVIEYINHNFSAFVFENRFGGTSSTPLYGYGNLGLSLGLVVNRIWYQVDATRRVVGQGPNYPGQNIINLFGGNSNTWLNMGGFIGSNFDVALRNYFVKTSVDYAWCYYEKYLLMDMLETEMNFGGWSVAISAGIRF